MKRPDRRPLAIAEIDGARDVIARALSAEPSRHPVSKRAREAAARFPSPTGRPFAAKTDKKCAKLYLFDAIGRDPWSGTGIDPMDVVKAINDAAGADELEVHISSPGGFVFDGIAIFNSIRAFKGKKTTYVDGLAASIASVIALAGDTVITGEGGTWMVHEPASGIMSFGTADQIEEDARKTAAALRSVRETILNIYENATGQNRKALSDLMAAETWMTAAEAKARGFTDEIAADAACDCACDECKAGDCPNCSCGGCASCAAGGGCDGGECDQGAGAKAKAAPSLRSKTPAELFAQACADADDLKRRFPAASRGTQQPGEPGAASHALKPGSRQEQKR